MTELTGRVLYPNDPGWNEARMNYNERFDVQPKAIVYCQGTQDVANAVRWGRDKAIPFRARGGGHSFEGYSLVQDGLVIDLSEMDTVSVNQERTEAIIGAGNYMVALTERLSEVGVTIPLATGPTVGIVGLALGGGAGLTSRLFGLTCDNILGVEMVDAEGNVIYADSQQNADLLWASQGGGGGNFGIVTALRFKVHKVGLVAIFNLQWTWDQFEKVFDLWQRWAPQVEDGVSSVLRLQSDRVIKMYGQFTAPADQLPRLSQLLAPMLVGTVPDTYSTSILPFDIAARLFNAEGTWTTSPTLPMWPVLVHDVQQVFKTTSGVALDFLAPEAISVLKKHLEAVPSLSVPPSQAPMVQLLPGGGLPSRVGPTDTACYYRDLKFIAQYDGYWTAPQDGAEMVAWVEGIRDAMRPYTAGAYVNYVDSQIMDYLQAYYGGNLARLVEVKQKYDPENVFNFPQSIPVSLLGRK